MLDEPVNSGPPRWTVPLAERIAETQNLSSHRGANVTPGAGHNLLSDNVRVLTSGLGRCGLSPPLSGPWPAYAFARAALAQETVDG